jgi:uncharacterized protein YkwD
MQRTCLLVIALLALGCAASTAAARTLRPAHGVELTINELRAEHGCEPLRVHAGLARAASRLARTLLADGELDHDAGTPFGDRLEQAAPAAHMWGETLAFGSGDAAQPDAIVESWMRSPEHRAIVLDCRFTLIGIGIATGRFGESGTGSVYSADFAA